MTHLSVQPVLWTLQQVVRRELWDRPLWCCYRTKDGSWLCWTDVLNDRSSYRWDYDHRRFCRYPALFTVERAFSLSKRCYGMGLIRTKLYDTTLTSIALSVFVTNLFKIQSRILFTFLWLLELLTHQSDDFELETV